MLDADAAAAVDPGWRRRFAYLALAIILLGFMVRVSTFKAPLFDHHAWRQAHTATMARNFYRENLNLLLPQVDERGAQSVGYITTGAELPAFAVALIAGAVSDFHFEIGRLLSSLFYLAAAGFLFAFVRRRYDLAHLFELGRSPASAAMLVAAVRFQVRVTGSDSPVGAATDRVLAGFRRAGSDRGRGQVAGVRWGQADAAAAVAANGGESIHGLRDAAILAVASDAMLRVSELAALRVGDIGAGEDNAATVTVRHSKTDQEGEGAVLFLGPSTAARISAWLGAAGVSTDDTDAPLFQRIDRGGTPRGQLSARSLRRIITARCSAAGVEGRISGHSLRVGSAQSLAAAGAGFVEMQQAGRWQSPTMPARYAAGELAARGAVARLRYGTAK